MSIELPNEFHPLLADYDPSDLQSYQAVWGAFRGLPEFSRNLLTSDELPRALKDLSVKFDFAQSTIMFVSVMVRKMIFREWDEERSQAELSAWCREFDSKNANHFQEIFVAVKNDILTIIPRKEEESAEVEKRETVQTTILEALSQYPQLGQQTITETRIKLKTSVELVRGSLINWLKYYRDELGVGYHDAMLRGQFLFRSQNGIKLTNEERSRIGILLRSIEDRELIEIDTEHQVLVFPPYFGPEVLSSEQKETSVPTVSAVPMKEGGFISSPEISRAEVLGQKLGETGAAHVLSHVHPSPPRQVSGTLHFSSNHVFPVEKEFGFDEEISEIAPNPSPSVSGKPMIHASSDPEKSVSRPLGANVTGPVQGAMTRPVMPAPKRNVNVNYIPMPFRIDPMRREQPEE
ncbi:MAG: hypothetical protein KA054_00980 [Candidatus Moranbacteria bacterium]|nr:hypothetical protein [Candidatus Moranbacteria bacterium]